jgi:CRISPR-associated protein Csd1
MVQLHADNHDPAYLCGRLMAVLENAQLAAMPGVNTTIVDRFYGTASTAPASVFSRLLKGVQPHLAKLQRDNRGAYIAIQTRIEEILSGLPGDRGFPRILSLQEQGMFALGYYHQRAQHSAQRREAAERRRQREAE